MIEVKFTDVDSVEIELPEGVLTCYRTNMDGGWHPVWLVTGDVHESAPEGLLTDEVLEAIREEEARKVRTPSPRRGDPT